MNNLIQSECEREIKKITRTIIILITLNICPIYAGNGHFKRPIRLSPRKFLVLMVFDRVKSFWEYQFVLIMSLWYGVLFRFPFSTILLAGFTLLNEMRSFENWISSHVSNLNRIGCIWVWWIRILLESWFPHSCYCSRFFALLDICHRRISWLQCCRQLRVRLRPNFDPQIYSDPF